MRGATGSASAQAIERLTEQRDLLLRSLDDLEREHQAGDLSDEDYEALYDSYTARAAAALRELDRAQSGKQTSVESNAHSRPETSEVTADPARPRGRTAIVIAGLCIFAVVAGLALARAAGERGVNDQITGAIDESPRNKVVRCQELGSASGDLLGALQCFDEILDEDPQNAEALSYRGWYLLLAAGSLQQADGSFTAAPDAEAQELIASGLSYLDRAIEADPRLPDPLAFRATVRDRLGQSELACADIDALLALNPPSFFLEQTTPIVERNGC